MMEVGDKVEVDHTVEWQQAQQERDHKKRAKLGVQHFMGNAAAYMHHSEAYYVTEITETGGLRLYGFVPTVSPRDVRLSNRDLPWHTFCHLHRQGKITLKEFLRRHAREMGY